MIINNIANLRKKKNMTQQELANEINKLNENDKKLVKNIVKSLISKSN